MEILILSKTHYGLQQLCVGGIALSNGHYLRLLNPDGWYQYPDTEFEVGGIWDISFITSKNMRPPHVEDVVVLRQEFIRHETNIRFWIENLDVPVWRGSADHIFEGMMNWNPKGCGYVNEKNGIPSHSVGFWIPDLPLLRQDLKGERSDGELYRSVRYGYFTTDRNCNLPYKGCAVPVGKIPAGTMVRVSLAKWWDTHGTTEERCALQLSGWYGLVEDEDENEDKYVLPF